VLSWDGPRPFIRDREPLPKPGVFRRSGKIMSILDYAASFTGGSYEIRRCY
jgi:hypothetical protein